MSSKPKAQNKQMHGRISPRKACNPEEKNVQPMWLYNENQF